ncbi:MAG: protein translocase subunit SecD, partial [Planctomycetes bacterium]|nr:protein translocase subunit SecD [Planctomycetota bacterium]
MLRRLIIIGLVFATTLGLLFLQNKILVGEQELQAELRPIDGSTTASTVVFKDLAGNFIPASAHEVAQIKQRLAGDRKKKEIAATVEGPTPQDTLIVTATKAGEDQIGLRQRLVGSPFRRPNPTRPLFHVTRGIDLQGGVEFVCQLFNAENKRVDAGDEEMRVLRSRLDARGLTEPTVTRMSNGDIQVVIPGGSRADAARTRKVLETTGRLEFREVIAVYGDVFGKVGGNHPYARTTGQWTGTKPGDPDCAVRVVNNRYVFRSPTEPFRNRGDIIAIEKSRDPTAVPEVFYHLGPPKLTGTDVSQATQELFQGQNAIGIQFTSSGTGRNEAFTNDVHRRGNAQQGTGHIAILFDGRIESDPHIESPSSSNCVVHGVFTKDEIESLQNALKGGSLAVTPVVISERVVGATLGVETVNRAIETMLWSFAAIVAFLALYYRRLGLVAMGCMVVLAALTYSALSVFGATLTLPGIAGLVLSVAMSIDTNVLIYERIREEQRAGKEARDAIEAGYNRAFLVIIDSHLTTMLTGVILYYVGSGPVKGFGLTLMLGVAISLFSNVYASRLFTDFICRGQKRIGMANLIPEPRLPYIGMRKITYALSIITGLAGIGWFAFGHHAVGGSFQRNFDIEFTGGNLVQVNFATPLERAQVESALEAAHKAAASADSMLDPASLSEPQAYFSAFGQGGASRQWVFRARDEAGSLIEEKRQVLSAEQGVLERELHQLRDGGDAVRKREVERLVEAKIKEVGDQQRLVATRTDKFKRQLAQAFAGSIAAEGDEITAASWNERTLSLTLATLDAPNEAALDSAASALRKRETLESVTVASVGDAAVKVDVTYRHA